jgi:uncharacterized protein YybS (DUF2232 family)
VAEPAPVHVGETPTSHDEPTSTRDTSVTRSASRRAAPGASWLPPLALAEGGLLLDVAVILDLAVIYLPIIGMVVAPAIPTPFALLMLRWGLRVSLLAGAVSAFLVTVIAGPHFGWRMGIHALVGILIGWIMRTRRSPWIALALCSLLVTVVGTGATLGVIFITGLPIKDVVDGLRNAMLAAESLAGGVAQLVGLESLWLAVRPSLVALAAFDLRFWPLLLFGYLLCFAIPTVAFYLAVATGTARVLGNDVRVFPPHWVLRLLWLLPLPLLVVASLPRRVAGLLRRHRQRDDADEASDPGDSSGSYSLDATKTAGRTAGDAR